MATTQTVQGINLVRGDDAHGDLKTYEVVVKVSGTYLTATKPTFDLLAALKAQRHEGITAVAVKRVALLRDYKSGSTVYTAPNANITLGGTGNKDITWRVDSGATNGDAGSEVADATAIEGHFTFLVVTTVTGT